MHTEAKKLYDASMARIITGREYQDLDSQAKDYWCWKWRTRNHALLMQEHEMLTPAPPPLPPTPVERASNPPVELSRGVSRRSAEAKLAALLVLLLVLLFFMGAPR